MMWVARDTYERLVKQAAQAELLELSCGKAEGRAVAAELALADERQRKDGLVIQLASRVITKHGAYGLEQEPQPAPAPHPKGFARDPTPEDIDVLNFYKACAAEANQSEQSAIDRWEAHMRGEDLYVDNTEM